MYQVAAFKKQNFRLIFSYLKFEIILPKYIFKDLTFLSIFIETEYSFHSIFTTYNFEDS